MKVVVFEDDATTLEALHKAFANKHVHFFGYTFPPPDAVDKVSQINPDAVVADVNMPGISGLELGKQLRADKRTQDLPIFFYSLMSQDAITHELTSIKNAAFFSKSEHTPAEVVESITSMVLQDQWSP